MPRASSAEVRSFDRRLALSFGAVVLVLILTAAGVAGTLFARAQAREEDRLAGAIGAVLSESFGRMAFSGRYQVRLLAEETAAAVPELTYISVETPEGLILAHSDPAFNGAKAAEGDVALSQRAIASGGTVTIEKRYGDGVVKEVITPFESGFESQERGVIRLGIVVASARRQQWEAIAIVLLVVAALTAVAMATVYALSRRFGGAVRDLAGQLQGLLAHAPWAIAIVDRNGAIRARGAAFERMFGGEDAYGTIGSVAAHHAPADTAAALSEMDHRVFREGVKAEADALAGGAGADRVWHVIKFPIGRDRRGEVTLGCTLIRDVTESHEAAERLRRSLHSLSESQRLALVGSWEYDVAANRAWWSEEMYRIHGCDPAGPPPDPDTAWLTWIHPEDRSRVTETIGAAAASYAPAWELMCRLRRPSDGAERILHILGRNTYGDGGALSFQVGVVQDITERARSEAERAELQAQLVQSQKLESVGRLAGGVAHDFNNMLQAILGYSDMALTALPEDHPVYEDVTEIRKAAEHSAQLTRQLLTFARRQEIEPRTLDLNATVGGMLKMLKRLLGEDVTLDWAPQPGLWTVKVDPTQIDQLLANLLVNARDSLGGPGRILIETSNVLLDDVYCAEHPECAPGEFVALSVRDNGHGIDKGTLAHIFEPFFTTKERGKGTGLGLAMVYGIVKQNYGSIVVESEPGAGSEFRIYLPRHSSIPEPHEEDADAPPATGSETVLIVEDEEMILRLGRRLLSGLGYRVLTAGAPGEAERIAREHEGTIDLLITDVVMPEMNGRDLADRLTALRPGLRRLFMSGYTENIIADRGVIEAGVDFLQKPFTLGELAAKVRRALDGVS